MSGMKSKKELELRAQPLSQEAPHPVSMHRGPAPARHHNEDLQRRRKTTILVSCMICIPEPGSQGVAEPMGDVNRNTSKKRKNTPAITMMDPLMKGNSKWFQIDHLHYGPEHPQRLAAAANHGGPR